jgi:hypothetical protein
MQSEISGGITEGYARGLKNAGIAYTGMLDGEVLFCCGMAKCWEGRWVLWSMLSKKAAKHMLRITRISKRLIELHCNNYGRLEVTVRSDFEQAHRWVKMLGVPFHHHEEKFLPGGHDADIYVRFS